MSSHLFDRPPPPHALNIPLVNVPLLDVVVVVASAAATGTAAVASSCNNSERHFFLSVSLLIAHSFVAISFC